MTRKSTKKKITSVLIVAVLTALAIGGMLAYLTDRDSEVNVFTLGNVYIDLMEEFDQGAELLPGREVTKEASIKNIGKSDAWVWLTVAVPSALDNTDQNKAILHCKYTDDPAWNVNNPILMKTTEIDKENYNVYTLLYNETLKPEEITAPGLYKVYLDKHVDVVDGKYYWVDGSDITYIDYDVAKAKVIVTAYAIQNEGFDTVLDAYNAFQTQWSDK